VESAISAIDGGATKYLQKPFEVDHFRSVVGEAMARRGSSVDVPSLNCKLDRVLEQLWMAYQPIVKSSTHTILAYEALLRTNLRDIAGPQEVIELAERTDRIFEVGRVIRARVSADIEALDEAVLVFVNLHPADLEDPELYSPDSPLALHASRVVLEITERASVSHALALEQKMVALRAMGYRIAVDDLGAGYAGLTTFARVRPEFVKLDASLVRDVDSLHGQQVVVSTVLQMANALNSEVVAEAIETDAERVALKNLGIDIMQGYFFARPSQPFVEVESFAGPIAA
jgi:EAL domain-containing protein (putative c-di-GMP-specific phosphodiesterase class I)